MASTTPSMVLTATVCGMLFSFLGFTVVIFSQNLIDALISSDLPLQQNSRSFEHWRKPPVMPLLKIYLFNVANSNEFLAGEEKLRLVEVGPYVYRQVVEKKNIVWHQNGTISYTILKRFTFDPKMSVGFENDVFILPNVPFLRALREAGQSEDKTKLLALQRLMKEKDLFPFSMNTVKQYLWGYDDALAELSGEMISHEQKFGYLAKNNMTPSPVFTVSTGAQKLDDFAQIQLVGGSDRLLKRWRTDECNEIRGSDGTAFPPNLDENSILSFYDPDFCRPIELDVQDRTQRVMHGGVGTLRFQPAHHVFGEVQEFPENKCYCSSISCPLQGTLNISKCRDGAPIVLSWPHFLNGDPELLKQVEGMSPDPEFHQFYVDVHPKLGSVMKLKARIQLNAQMTRTPEYPQGENFTDMLIPILWMEGGFDELPAPVIGLMKEAISIPTFAVTLLSYVLMTLGLVTLSIGMAQCLRNNKEKKQIPATTVKTCKVTIGNRNVVSFKLLAILGSSKSKEVQGS